MLSNDSLSISNIAVLYKRNNQWYYDCAEEGEIELKTDVDVFLSENIQFIKIDLCNIINLNYLEDYSLKGTIGFVIVSKLKYNIEGSFLTNAKVSLKKFQKRKNNPLLPSTVKGTWLHGIKKNQPDKSLTVCIDAENIKYMLRKGSSTYAFYENEKQRHFFDTLRYFENNLDSSILLVRINRNCIINLKYMNSYDIYTQPKTGQVNIDEHIFKISRRQLGTFRRKVKRCQLVFAIEKIVK